jgi:hypothetical protein
MPGRWQISNGVKYPVVECRMPDEEDLADFFNQPPRKKNTEEMDGSKKLRKELDAAQKELARLKKKKKFEDLGKENHKWETMAIEEKIRLKKDARQQCLELVDDTLPPGVNLTQDEDGWGGAWMYDFLQEANSFWTSLPSDEVKTPNKKGKNVSVSSTSHYNVAAQRPGLSMYEDFEIVTQLLDGRDIVSPKKLFSEMVVHWFEGNKGLRGISVGEWRDFGFWGSSKYEEIKKSTVFHGLERIFQEMEKEINTVGKSKFVSKGTPIKVNQHAHWPIINRLYEGYKAELPKKISFNPQAPEFFPGKTFTATPIMI